MLAGARCSRCRCSGIGPRLLRGLAVRPRRSGRSGWPTSSSPAPCTDWSGSPLRLLALALPGLLLVRVHRSGRPRRRPGAELARARRGSPTARWPRSGCCRCWPTSSSRCAGPAAPAGSAAGWNPVARLHGPCALLFALLVQAIRRAVRLAAAMDARGFDVPPGPHVRPAFGPARPRPLVVIAAVLLAVVSPWPSPSPPGTGGSCSAERPAACVGVAGEPRLSDPSRTVEPCASSDIVPSTGTFEVVSDFEPSGDQPAAIDELEKRIRDGERPRCCSAPPAPASRPPPPG